MLGRGDAFDNLFPAGMAVQAVIQFRLCDVVGLGDGFLSIRIGSVFPQYAYTSWLDHVRVDAVVDDELDKGRVVDQ